MYRYIHTNTHPPPCTIPPPPTISQKSNNKKLGLVPERKFVSMGFGIILLENRGNLFVGENKSLGTCLLMLLIKKKIQETESWYVNIYL
jgi:hypothetical protein